LDSEFNIQRWMFAPVWQTVSTVTILPVVRHLRFATQTRIVPQRSSESVTRVEPVLTPGGAEDDELSSVVDAGAASVSDASISS
jgi:hypothetical protein